MPKEQTLIIIFVVVLLVVAAIVFGVRARSKKEKKAKESKMSDFVGVPLAQQLAPPGGFTFEQQVVLGENQ